MMLFEKSIALFMYSYYFLPFMSACIGGSITYVLIKLLFHPQKPVWIVQGILYAYRTQIAQHIASYSFFDIIPTQEND